MTEEDPVVQWLLQGDPAIRWQVLRDLLDAPPVEVAAERVEHEGWVRGCWRCGLLMACGRTAPAFRIRRLSQRTLRGLWQPVSRRHLSRRPTWNRPR
jgi:hypothetical protein